LARRLQITNSDKYKIPKVRIILNKELGIKINTTIHYNKRIIAVEIRTKQLDTCILAYI